MAKRKHGRNFQVVIVNTETGLQLQAFYTATLEAANNLTVSYMECGYAAAIIRFA